MLVYIDDIMLNDDDTKGIANVKKASTEQFMIKDLGPLWYILGIEVASRKKRIILSQRKYETYLLKKIGMLGSKPINILIDPKAHIYDCKDKEVDTWWYRSLIGKLLNLTIMHPDFFPCSGETGQFMDKHSQTHLDSTVIVLQYIKSSPRNDYYFLRQCYWSSCLWWCWLCELSFWQKVHYLSLCLSSRQHYHMEDKETRSCLSL